MPRSDRNVYDNFYLDLISVNYYVRKRTVHVPETNMINIHNIFSHRFPQESSIGMDYAYIDYEGTIVKEIYDDIKTTDGRFQLRIDKRRK